MDKHEFLMEQAQERINNMHLGIIHTICKTADELGLERDRLLEDVADYLSFFSKVATVIKFDLNTASNGDKIRAMTDKELAEWLHNLHQYNNKEPMLSIINLDTNKETVIHDSYGDLLEWLQQTESED